MDETQAPPAVTRSEVAMAKANAKDIAEKDTGNVVGDHSPEQMDLFNLWLQGTVAEDSDESAAKVPETAGTP